MCAELFDAMEKCNVKLVEQLLESVVDINITDGWGETLLHVAGRLGNEDICKAVLKRNPNLNAKNILEFTPVWTALFFGNKDVAKLIAKHKRF